ncbi:hypothetical protein ASPWEDRAFT_100010 [Aspergillus wentii DTO 134E9]|uniref:ABC a-pheromone efflux pump AtrD n=1 Tax=Aspergillus wentii DTO 134E9 TaxID=1073089 RepID=A0A1L9S1C4_ASPWE|nr:uncharacterized protein ASPWEDRAFT_100010 [Aspergillus wentii DTO 134E9]OJJ40957.1 hypothetical protein ASPWEDRAFT_100010 [Aspergillus wentii DTO 134E9]
MSLFNFTTKKHIPTLVSGLVFSLAASLSTLVFAILLGKIFNSFMVFGAGEISSQDLIKGITTDCIGLAGLGAAGWVLNAGYFTLFVAFGELQVANARGRVFERLLKRDLQWFQTQQDGTGAFLSSLQAQIHDLQMATSQPLGLVVHYSFRSVASLLLALYTSWKLSLVTLAGIPIFSAIVGFISPRMTPNIEAQQAELAHASKIANSAIKSIDTVKSLNGQTFELLSFACTIDRASTQYLKQARLNSLQIAMVRLMMFGMFVQGFWYGCLLAGSGELSASLVLRTFWACLTAAQSIELVLPEVIVLRKGKVAATALGEIINQTGRTAGEMKGIHCPRYCEGDIEVNNVSFSYSSQPERPVLETSSFFFPAGEMTFITGKSGSGKSTLGNLLTRFYSPMSGEILIDNVPIQTLSINWIRNNITLVEQQSILFNESILTNIAFGRRDYDKVREEDVQKCIDLAMLEDTIDNMPNGIDTCVGHGGNFLSGGQRQRVALARARLRDTPILILDEPTSSLDYHNRTVVMKAIREWRKGKTTIVITHDMSHILEKDFVYILDEGQVVQAGYRHELENGPKSAKYFRSVTKEDTSQDTRQNSVSSCSETNDIPDFGTDVSSVISISTDSFHDVMKACAPSNNALQTSEAFVDHEPRSKIQEESRPLSKFWKMIRKKRNAMYGKRDLTTSSSEIELDRIQVRPKHDQLSRVSSPVSSQTTQISSNQGQEPCTQLQNTASMARIMLTIIPNLSPWQCFLLFLGFLCALGHALATPAFSYCLSQLFCAFYDRGRTTQLAMKWSLAVLGVAIGDGTVSFFMHYFLELCGQAWVDGLRKKAFCRVLDQPRMWFEDERNSPSKLTACLDQNGEDMRTIIGRFAGFVLVAATIAIVAVAWSFIVCWKLSIVALACGPVIYAITRGFEGTSGLWEKRCNEANRVVSDIFVETFSEIRTVRSLTLESFFHRKHVRAASRCMRIGLRRAGYTGFLFGLVMSTVVFVSALIFYYGAVLVSSSEYTVKDITTVFSMLLFSIGYASTVLSWIPQISISRDTAAQLLRLANLPQGASHEYLGNVEISKVAPVKLKKLNFRYPSRSDALVLRNVFITIPQDSCTAIVGRSGSGKSTIASLLLSLYEAPLSKYGAPTISLGGVDIRNLHTPTLRSMISIVSQQPTIFLGTIHANISYGLDEDSPLSTLHNVRAAAKAAGIDEFISSLPSGYSTLIGDGGVGLSGGQAQRVVIARALVRRPQILILDEATSSLDRGSAEVIRQTVQKLVAAQLGLTVIIITHAREMMEISDNVIVMEEGAVIEEGGYYELLKRPGGALRALIEDE